MALKKSQLYSSLWQSCDELRGGMDASQYKDYVLTLLFMKYVSDKYASKVGALIEVPKGGGFADMVALEGDKEIGDKINKIIGRLAEANDLKGVIDQADFNDEGRLGAGKEMQDRLSKLVAIFDGLDFRANRAEGDDLLGDAYEYLMRHFATESGKSKGQFYTPAEVSRIMAQVIGLDRAGGMDQPTVYDPTCGSGSLLIKAADQATTTKLAIYGQEMDVATWALARMNMILHGHPTAEIWRGNTLAAPHFKNKDGSLRTFDFAVANPPFSAKAWSSGLDPEHDEFGRFELGVPPAKNGDYAFLLHLIKSLKSNDKGAIILPHGVLFRGNREADIRRNLVSRGLIKAVIGLPANLFYGTGIPACIVVIDKEHAHARTGVFMIDASKGFLKDGNKNRLRAQDIHKIVDAFNRQIELPRYSRMVPVAEIASPANDYNLNIPRYIDSSEPEDLQDLDAHLNGGIPERDIDALADYWEVFPGIRNMLFASHDELCKPNPDVPNEYADTCFVSGDGEGDWPERFAIITAYATTGHAWPAEKNARADDELHTDLTARGTQMRRITGYSPRSGHSEPGWAVEISLEEACDVGRRCQQDAIFWVDGDELQLSRCRDPRAPIRIGSFRVRLHRAVGRPVARPGYAVPRLGTQKVKSAILEHADFKAFAARVATVFEGWRQAHELTLEALDVNDLPKTLIHTLSEDILSRFAGLPLLDRYDVYQRLMDYWADVMQDDVYLIAADGWVEAAKPRGIVEDRERKIKEIPDLVVKRRKCKMDLVPPALVVARWFAKEQAAIEALQAEQEATVRELEEFVEEHAGEEGLLADAVNERGKVTKGGVKARLEAIEDEPESDEERDALTCCLALIDAEAEASKAVGEARAALDENVLARYGKLTEAEIKTLVIEEKWFASLSTVIESAVQCLSQKLAGRVTELKERYARALPTLERNVEAFSASVRGQLESMGQLWE